MPQAETTAAPGGQPTFGAAFPAYKNAANLRRCLKSLARISPPLFQRTVVVDDSGNGEVTAALRREYPVITWIVHERNLGFGPSATEAVTSCDAGIVVLLNDDVTLLTDPCAALSELFRDENLFAVTFQSQHADGSFREGAKRLVWPMGLPRVLHNPADQLPPVNGRHSSAYAVGGHAAYRKSMFTALGGFDPLFAPFYWEDVDLCARAAARNWRTAYSPECVVMHDDGGAIHTTFARERIEEATQRNRLLFAWRHVPAPLRPLQTISLGYRLACSTLLRDRVFRQAYRSAQDKWRQVSGDSHDGKD